VTVLVLAPGPTWSTADVEDGLTFGLKACGARVVRFAMGGRLNASEHWLKLAHRLARRKRPELAPPTFADACYHAGLGAVERALATKADVVLAVSGLMLHPSLLGLLREARKPVGLLLTESPYETAHEIARVKLADVAFTSERTAVTTYAPHCPRVVYLRHAWHPLRHSPEPRPTDDLVRAHDVVFVGTAFAERVAFLGAVDWAGCGLDLGLYGHWHELPATSPLRPYVRGGEVMNAATTALYRRAKVGLNLYRTSCGYGPDVPHLAPGAAESLSPRAYELAACGVFHATTERAEVAEVFGDLLPRVDLGRPEAAGPLLRRWVDDDDGRAAVAAQLPHRVARASWVERAAEVLDVLDEVLTRAPAAPRAVQGAGYA
jgi:hypothetical protein